MKPTWGLVPYSGELQWSGVQVVTANRTVMHGREVRTEGVLLESVSLVCVWGVDVWCGRVSPSATFDVLNEEIKAAEQGLFDLDQDRAFLVRALNGQTGD